MVDDDDLDAEFAQFEAQIQSVVSKPKPKPPPASSPSVSKPSPSTASTAATPSSTATEPAPVTGKWKWDGAKWNWVVTTPTQTPASSSRPVAPVRPLSSIPTTAAPPLKPSSAPLRPAGPSLPAQSATPIKRTAAGDVWRDPTLADWPANDHRIFVGDLAPDATDAELQTAFSRYPSFNMARIVKDKRSGLCKGYGFVSFAAGEDMIAALKEMNGKYVGSRPVKLRKSTWEKRNLDKTRRKELKLFKEIVKKSKK